MKSVSAVGTHIAACSIHKHVESPKKPPTDICGALARTRILRFSAVQEFRDVGSSSQGF